MIVPARWLPQADGGSIYSQLVPAGTIVAVTNEAHLPDGTIIDASTLEVLRTPLEASKEAGETVDIRVVAAKKYLATHPEPAGLTDNELVAEHFELRRLLRLVLEVCDDWAVTDPDSLDYVPVS